MNKRKGKVLIDGIADQHALYEKCEKHNKHLLTPPRQGASVRKGSHSKQEAVKGIKVLGRGSRGEENLVQAHRIQSKSADRNTVFEIEKNPCRKPEIEVRNELFP